MDSFKPLLSGGSSEKVSCKGSLYIPVSLPQALGTSGEGEHEVESLPS